MAGSIILTAALVFALFSVAMYYMAYRGNDNTLNYARIAFHLTTTLIIIAATYLMYLILTHQYQYNYIYSYSNSDLSLGLLISTFWAGQEGSFLLWVFFTVLVGQVVMSYTAKRENLEPAVMSVYTLITFFMIMMVTPLMKNPFEYIWAHETYIALSKINPAYTDLKELHKFFFTGDDGKSFVQMGPELYAQLQAAGIAISDFILYGKGLNPLLQNFWMQIHPPILFIGFALGAVPYSFAIAALMRNDYKSWIKQSFPWILACSAILGLGIMLGGYWAYGILGWGGYWGWDPVENASLVPWIVSVAVIHTLLVQARTQGKDGGIGKYAKTNLILSILVYVLIIYSTFLTRSGILGEASVHSFVDPGAVVYLFLVIFILTFLSIGVGMIIYRWKTLTVDTDYGDDVLSRDMALFASAMALGASALIVLAGTSAPIFGGTVEISFYNEMHLPLAIIFGILNGFSMVLKWRRTNVQEMLKSLIVPSAVSVALTLLIVLWGGISNVMIMLLAFAGVFTVIVNVIYGVEILKMNRKQFGAYLSHIGFGLFLLGVLASSVYSVEKDLDLYEGDSASVFGYDIRFTGYEGVENNKKFAFNIEVEKDGAAKTVSPVMYVSDFNNSLMREPDIIVGFAKDFYFTPLGYEDGKSNHSHGDQLAMMPGETKEVHGTRIKYVEFIRPDMTKMANGEPFNMGAKLEVTHEGETHLIDAIFTFVDGQRELHPVKIGDTELTITLGRVDVGSKRADLEIDHPDHQGGQQTSQRAYLSVTASIKPFVSLVWIGVAVMFIGFIYAMYRRSGVSHQEG